jgi:lysyl-tRNA synthetase, class II
MATIDDLKKVRQEKLEKLKNMGLNPYPGTVFRSHSIIQARELINETVSLTGRVMSMRGHGKIIFLDLVDSTGKIQIAVKEDVVGSESFSRIELVDVGDFLEVGGEVGKTQAGETTVFAKEFRIISKSIRPLPDLWHGLKDVEERYRQRYVDLVMNPEVKEVFKVRAKVVKLLREHLDKEGFIEVETPVLQPIYGGASAKPFSTHHNSLDVDMFLRISDELYLKRLIVGGFDRVYELSKDFRNEGIDRQHNPEFTMLEFYWAYANYEDLMKYTESLLSSIVFEIKGTMKVTFEGEEIDFTPPWPRKTYRDVVLEYSGIDINVANTEELLIAQIKEKHPKVDLTGVVGFGAAMDTVYKATARPHLKGPMFLTDRPTAFVALAKRLPNDPTKTASFQLLVVGKEVLNAYNELNDPEDQAKRWLESEKLGEKGQDEHEAFDHDYIRALEYGMPPTAGWGMGIDRFVSLLMDQHTIKDVILFPTLKPEFSPEPQITKKKAVQLPVQENEKVSREQATQLLVTHMQNGNLQRHCYAVGYAMKELAREFGGDPDVWEVLGILHDADWEETKDNPDDHTKNTLQYLKDLGVTSGPIVRALQSHNRKRTHLAEIEGVMEWALETCDELTGFIVAVTLVRPEKKLAAVTTESVLKKWKNHEFAQAVDRSQIEQCKAELGISLEAFIGIVLSAMQSHSDELGL